MSKQNKTAWHGITFDKAESLLEYKFLVRYVPARKEWEVIYPHPHISRNFDSDFISEDDIKEMYQGGWMEDKMPGFLDFLGLSIEEWEESCFSFRINDLIQYFGAHNLFGESYTEGMTPKEVCKYTHIKYEECYEETHA